MQLRIEQPLLRIPKIIPPRQPPVKRRLPDKEPARKRVKTQRARSVSSERSEFSDDSTSDDSDVEALPAVTYIFGSCIASNFLSVIFLTTINLLSKVFPVLCENHFQVSTKSFPNVCKNISGWGQNHFYLSQKSFPSEYKIISRTPRKWFPLMSVNISGWWPISRKSFPVASENISGWGRNHFYFSQKSFPSEYKIISKWVEKHFENV